MTAAEHVAIAAGTSGLALMERAGEAVAACCLDFAGHVRSSAAVLCGPGNNGGDGFVAARILARAGWEVCCYATGDLVSLPPDAQTSARQWTGETRFIERFEPIDESLVVDALFGAGLKRDLAGPVLRLVEKANASAKPIISVDMASGVDGNTGDVRGGAIKAAATVTFGRAKPGHYLYPGAAKAGRVIVADIGLAAELLDRSLPRTTLNTPALWLHRYPWPRTDGHKYHRGHAVVVSGALSHTGAARMAARAALRIGAGLVTIASPSEALAVNAAHLTAVMLRASDGPEGLTNIVSDSRKNAIVLGPGLGVGRDTRKLVEVALAATPGRRPGDPARACLLDADALTSFEGEAHALAAMIAAAPGGVVITPHEGEFGRLFAADRDVTGARSKLDRARAAADRLGCVVVLKGADTVVAAPEGSATISDSAVPWLATAGSGDVLSGVIGGLLAQGMPAFEAANAGTFLHAEAGRHFGPGLIAEDLPEALPAALRALRQQGGY